MPLIDDINAAKVQARYLAGVARSTIEDVNFGPFDPAYSLTRGTAVPARPVPSASRMV